MGRAYKKEKNEDRAHKNIQYKEKPNTHVQVSIQRKMLLKISNARYGLCDMKKENLSKFLNNL